MDISLNRTLDQLNVSNPAEDLKLVDRCLQGDMRAFDELMIRYERQIYRLCYRFVDNPADARDLAQDVFIKVFENLSGFRREASVKTWIYRIAMNHCLNHVRKLKPEFVEVTDATKTTGPTALSRLEERERREHLRRMLTQLPPKQKAILEMRINQQLSYEEIAAVSGRSISTIKASVFFALEKLRKLAGNHRTDSK
jgi:RNA polymerase sigma-70 factor (ECF subfamily)